MATVITLLIGTSVLKKKVNVLLRYHGNSHYIVDRDICTSKKKANVLLRYHGNSHYIVDRDICTSKKRRTYYCVTMATVITLFIGTSVLQKKDEHIIALP